MYIMYIVNTFLYNAITSFEVKWLMTNIKQIFYLKFFHKAIGQKGVTTTENYTVQLSLATDWVKDNKASLLTKWIKLDVRFTHFVHFSLFTFFISYKFYILHLLPPPWKCIFLS